MDRKKKIRDAYANLAIQLEKVLELAAEVASDRSLYEEPAALNQVFNHLTGPYKETVECHNANTDSEFMMRTFTDSEAMFRDYVIPKTIHSILTDVLQAGYLANKYSSDELMIDADNITFLIDVNLDEDDDDE